MYGISSDFDPSFFVGKTLTQVCIGFHEAILRFDGDISITIMSDISHETSVGEVIAIYKAIGPSAPMLIGLLHLSVETASTRPPGTLILGFSGGEKIAIDDTFSEYESYIITHKAAIICV